MIATAPGKLMLAGEYAVLHGGPAVMAAVDRRVRARESPGAPELSPFLAAAAVQIERARGDGPAARAARAMVVDSRALHEGDVKLGLGSSAASTVAAIACALAHEDGDALDRDEVHRLAAAAHGDAQALRGARGSGADIAASTYGGVIVFTGGAVRPLALPAGLVLVAFWTGAPADTASLVAAVTRTAPMDLLENLADAALALAEAKVPAEAIAAIDRGADAVDALGRAASIDLLTDAVRRARDALAAQGGAAKTCGAGGGDVAIAALPPGADVTRARAEIVAAGCTPLGISVGAPGVDIVDAPE